jgi:hypothetical protein
VHLKLTGLTPSALGHLLAYFREHYIHVDSPIDLPLHSSSEGVGSLFQKYNLEFIHNGHVQGINFDLKQAHLAFHLFYTGFGLFQSLSANNVLGFSSSLLGKRDLGIHLIDDFRKVLRWGINLEIQTIQFL